LKGLDLTRQNPTITGLVDAFSDPSTSGGTIDAVRGLWPSILRRTVTAAAASDRADAQEGSAGADTAASAPQLIVTATTREAEDLAQALADWVPASTVSLPQLGDAAAREAVPAIGHRRPAPRGAPTPGPSPPGQRTDVHHRPGASLPPASGEGPRRHRTGGIGRRRRM